MYIIPPLSLRWISDTFHCASPEDFFYMLIPYMRIPPCVLLLSGERTDCSRYCIAGWDPLIILWSKGKETHLWIKEKGWKKSTSLHPLFYLDRVINEIESRNKELTVSDSFIGGFMGYVAYEYKNMIEPCLTRIAKDDLALPDMFWIYPSKVVVFDKENCSATVYVWSFSDNDDPTINIKTLMS